MLMHIHLVVFFPWSLGDLQLKSVECVFEEVWTTRTSWSQDHDKEWKGWRLACRILFAIPKTEAVSGWADVLTCFMLDSAAANSIRQQCHPRHSLSESCCGCHWIALLLLCWFWRQEQISLPNFRMGRTLLKLSQPLQAPAEKVNPKKTKT